MSHNAESLNGDALHGGISVQGYIQYKIFDENLPSPLLTFLCSNCFPLPPSSSPGPGPPAIMLMQSGIGEKEITATRRIWRHQVGHLDITSLAPVALFFLAPGGLNWVLGGLDKGIWWPEPGRWGGLNRFPNK